MQAPTQDEENNSYLSPDDQDFAYHHDGDGRIVRRSDRLVLWEGDRLDDLSAVVAGVSAELAKKTVISTMKDSADKKEESPTLEKPSLITTGDDKQGTAARQAAARLVQDILEQVSCKDAPPSNVMRQAVPAPILRNHSGSSDGSFPSVSSQSSAVDVPPAPQENGSGDSVPSEDEAQNSATMTTAASSQHQGQLLGHSDLISLCQSTLERVEGSVGAVETEVNKQDAPLKESQIEATASAPAQKEPVKSSSSPTALGPNVNSQNKSRFRLLRRGKSNPASSTTSATGLPPRAPSLPPLHMFGSEYARHVSKTPLAPTGTTMSRRRSSSSGRRRSSLFSLTNHSQHSRSGSSLGFALLQDAEPAVQCGALLDLVVTYGSDPAPLGYYTILPPVDEVLVEPSKKLTPMHFYLHVKMEPVWDKAAQRPCITALTLLHADRNEFVPPGFCVAKVYAPSGKPPAEAGGEIKRSNSGQQHGTASGTTLANVGTDERLFLAFKRSREGNPITGLLWIRPDAGDIVPAGYTVIEKSPRNHTARLSPNKTPMFLAIRQRLANLECLRPLPLVQQHVTRMKSEAIMNDPTTATTGQKRSPASTLQAYFVTGGTVVDAKIGRYHIMDRSTHAMLSPSSVRNRLQLIQESRGLKASSSFAAAADREHDDDSVVSSTVSVSRAESFAMDENNESFVSFSQRDSSSFSSKPTDMSQTKMFSSRDSDDSSCCSAQADAKEVSGASKYILSSLLARPGGTITPSEIEKCVEAFNFIPTVEAAVSHSGDGTVLGVKHLSARATVLTPILTACYTRHGGSALVAVEGLTALLQTTDFFADDVDRSDKSDNESSTRLTLLDLSVQVVCDVTTTGAQETTFGSCVEFVESAIRFSQGQLNTRTIGYVLRFYLFVFYFGASSPSNKASSMLWPSTTRRAQTPEQELDVTCCDDEDDIPMLFDPRCDGQLQGYLPASQAAALALKELVSLSIVRLGKVSVNEMLVQANAGKDFRLSHGEAPSLQSSSTGSFLDSVLSSVVDDAVDHVEIANYTQLALHQIQRSGGSELFWHEMVNECGLGLFGKDQGLSEAGRDIYIMLFAVMANLVKVSAGKMRMDSSNSDLLPRDISSKLLSLELLLHFLEYWSDEQQAINGMTTASANEASDRSIRTLAFTIRRMVAPALLSNTRAALENPRVFSRLIRIVSELWCSPIFRRYCKAEIAILMDLFALRMLQLGPQLIAKKKIDLSSENATASLLSQQVALINEIKGWFAGDPKDVIEFYLNYDTDIAVEPSGQAQLLSGTHLQVFQGLCSGLSNVAEQCGELIGKQIRESQSKIESASKSASTMPSSPTGELVDTLARMQETKSVGIETTSVLDAARLLRKTSLEAISQIVKALAISAAAATSPKFTALLLSWTPPDSPIAYEKSFAFSSSRSDDNEDCTSSDLHVDTEDVDGSGDKVTQFWQEVMAEKQKESGLDLSPSSRGALETALEIAETKSLKKAVEYLIACNALTPAPRDIATYLWIHKQKLDPSDLGNYLGEIGSGGAETEYWNAIRQSYVRAISFNGMNVEEGLRHFLTNCGFRLPGEAQKIDRILNTFAQCYFEDNAGDTQRCPFKEEDVVFVLSFAIIMLNTDLHKANSSRKPKKKMTKQEFVNNLRGIAHGEDIDRDYLSTIFDSIEQTPIEMHDGESQASTKGRHHVLRGMLKNVRTAEALLRSLAVHDFKFVHVEDFADDDSDETGRKALSDLTRSCVGKTWYQWHGVVNTGLEMAHLDPQGMYPSVEILLYALSVSVCLGMPTERDAFLSQLGRLKAFEERREGWIRTTMDSSSFRDDDWYIQIAEAAAGTEDRRLWALREIHSKIESLQSALLVDVQNKAAMTKAVSQLVNGEFLLLDPARSFVRSGDLVKKSDRTGRAANYRFFLFSDALLYGHEEPDGRYLIHEELSLHLMKVVDWFPPSQKNRRLLAEIHHPRKSFQILFTSVEERASWVEAIRDTISSEVHHKVKQEAARLAVYTRG